MQSLFESMRALQSRYTDDEAVLKIVEGERQLALAWIAETKEPEPRTSRRTLGAVDATENKHGTRSIFDDIDEG